MREEKRNMFMTNDGKLGVGGGVGGSDPFELLSPLLNRFFPHAFQAALLAARDAQPGARGENHLNQVSRETDALLHPGSLSNCYFFFLSSFQNHEEDVQGGAEGRSAGPGASRSGQGEGPASGAAGPGSEGCRSRRTSGRALRLEHTFERSF